MVFVLNATPAQISLAWHLAQKPWIVPIPGTVKLHHMEENQGALNISFTANELKEFRAAFEKTDLIEVRTTRFSEINRKMHFIPFKFFFIAIERFLIISLKQIL